MIVVDTNVTAHLYLPSEYTTLTETLLAKDSTWAAPVLWRSELRNILALYMRKHLLSFEHAYAIQMEAEQLLAPNEFAMDSFDILTIAKSSTLSAYDAEFVALANSLGVPLVTLDKKVLNAFPETACLPESMAT